MIATAVALGLGAVSASCAPAGAPANVAVPGVHWARLRSPAAAGWDTIALQRVRQQGDSGGITALMIVQHGLVVSEWGDVAARVPHQSTRKSFMSALIGIAVARKQIRLDATMASLGIDDLPPPLTPLERNATVRHLLMARSGVYHPAAAAGWPIPERGSHAPNTYWWYNNWDFNVLGTIFEQRTKIGIYDALKAWIADPIQMEDFRVEDGHSYRDSSSIHAAYMFDMSARDMARFGLLYLRNGRGAIASGPWTPCPSGR